MKLSNSNLGISANNKCEEWLVDADKIVFRKKPHQVGIHISELDVVVFLKPLIRWVVIVYSITDSLFSNSFLLLGFIAGFDTFCVWLSITKLRLASNLTGHSSYRFFNLFQKSQYTALYTFTK